MKKLLVILCIPVFLMISCKQDEGPRPVAEKFLTAMQAHQYEEAGKYGTDETLKLLKQFEKIEKLNGIDSSLESTGKITILSEDIKGKTAIVYFKEDGNEIEQHITLQKVDVDGHPVWRVALKKEEIRLMQEPA
ncbi:MAG: DUF4878 domain-containing protein [Bacteroidia bacterium]|nr:DUF4878 domain-containing protein [Bacteroidia bacterium]